MSNPSIKKNFVFNLINQVVNLIIPFITIPYISRVLSPSGVGLVSYSESIVAYFVLVATFGIGIYGQREISYVRDSLHLRSAVFWNITVLKSLLSLVAFVGYLGFAYYQEQQLLYFILSINIIAVIFDITWFFQGMEQFGKILTRNLIIKILNTASIFIFVKEQQDLNIYVFILSVFVLVSNASLWTYLKAYICKVKLKEINPFKHFYAVLSLFIPTIAVQIYTVLDKTMICLITQDLQENGYYEFSQKISKITLTIITALAVVMFSRISFYFSNNDLEKVKSSIYQSYRFAWFLGIPLCFGLMGISDNFVPWFLGSGYEKVSLLLKISSFLILAIGINNVTGVQYLIPVKKQNLFTLTVVIGAIVNFVLNLFLIKCYASVGACLASVTAESVIALVQFYIVREQFSFIKVIILSTRYLIAGAVMLLIIIFANKYLTPSIFNTIILVVSGSIIYFACLILMKDQFVMDNIRALLDKIKVKI